jgi:hypothetical protein
LRILADLRHGGSIAGVISLLSARQPIGPESVAFAAFRKDLLKGRPSSIAASLTMAATATRPPTRVAKFRAPRRTQTKPRRVPAGFAIGADRRRTDGGNEARAHGEKEAGAELDHPEESNARGRNSCGPGGRDGADIRTARAMLRGIDRAPGLAGYSLRGDRTKAPVSRSAVARVRRNGVLEKAGADIQAESSQTERCAQNKRTQQSDGHQRIKAGLGFDGAYRDVRSGIHGNLQWKNHRLQKLLWRRHNLNFDCGE